MEYRFDDPKLAEKLQPQTVTTPLGEIEYAEFGSGPAVVALHGAMGGYDQSAILAQTVGGEGYRYIAVTRPGYLGTPLASGASPEHQADLIVALLDSLSIDRVGILAVSGGGPAALQFGIKHEDRCHGLVLCSTFADIDPMPIPFAFKLMTALARRPWFGRMLLKKASKDLTAIAKRSIRDPQILNRTVSDDTIWPLFSTMMLSTYRQMERRLDGTMNDINITRTQTYELEKLNRPVLVVHGTDDPLVNFERNTKAYESRLPDVRVLPVEGGEHVAIFTHHDLIRPKVREFTDSLFQ